MKRFLKSLLALGIMIALLLQIIIAVGWIFPKGGRAKYVLILGAKIEGEEPSEILQMRILEAQRYLIENPNSIAVACGGMGPDESFSEAQVIKNALMKGGVEEEKILLEENSTSTWENLTFALERIEATYGENPEEIMVATNNYHVFRVGFLADRLGVRVYPLIADTPLSHIPRDFSREMLAIVKSFIFDRK